MPSFSGFASKWTIITSSILSGGNTVYLVMFGIVALFTSAITLASYVKFFGMTFTSSGADWNVTEKIKEVSGIMILPKVILAILCVVQGLLPYFYYNLFFNIFKNSAGSTIHAAFNSLDFNSLVNNTLMGVTLGIPVSGATLSGAVIVPIVTLVILIVAVIFSVILRKSGGSTEKEAATWLCGYQDLNNLNRYKSKNMYSAFKKMLWWTGGNQH
jgi:NADH:ubiquinone oxidoreductase subunit 5 (subunit L)/multisubunit Na+/H+ antiporter MnhA subunit